MYLKMKFFAILFLSVGIQLGFSQKKLTGKVMKMNNEPIANALVYLDDKDSGMVTNQRGYFQVDVPDGTKEINIIAPQLGLLSTPYAGNERMNFVYLNYEPDQEEAEKASIGYGEVAREDLTYSIQKLEIGDRDQVKGFNNIYDLIRARVPGVLVTENNRIYIRGASSIRDMNNTPLFVVNGTIVPAIDYILPSEVKNIDILKDAAASIYGSRGANGVILITLKD